MLLNAGANVNFQNPNNGQTVLMLAILRGYPEVVQVLVESGADPNIKNIDGDTALDFSVLGLSIKSNKNVDVPPFIKNAFQGGNLGDHTNIFKLFLQLQHLNINSQDNNGYTCLMAACQTGQLDVAKALLQRNVNHSIQNNNGWTALMIAFSKRLY